MWLGVGNYLSDNRDVLGRDEELLVSDAVLIALITNLTTILVVIVSRVISHREHKKTEATGDRTERKVNRLLNGSLEN